MLIDPETAARANRTIICRHNRDSSRLKLNKTHFTGKTLLQTQIICAKHRDLSFRDPSYANISKWAKS